MTTANHIFRQRLFGILSTKSCLWALISRLDKNDSMHLLPSSATLDTLGATRPTAYQSCRNADNSAACSAIIRETVDPDASGDPSSTHAATGAVRAVQRSGDQITDQEEPMRIGRSCFSSVFLSYSRPTHDVGLPVCCDSRLTALQDGQSQRSACSRRLGPRKGVFLPGVLLNFKFTLPPQRREWTKGLSLAPFLFSVLLSHLLTHGFDALEKARPGDSSWSASS
ncbi:hypothetical protein LZ31DRAFT_22722 [Colletotrichum somersetense]|nr:hypothetical protein LZ31DRAFT_22722 [Colletotrichum somersetense]